MSDSSIIKHLALPDYQIVAEGISLPKALDAIQWHPNFEKVIASRVGDFCRFSDVKGGISKHYPDETQHQVKYRQTRELLLVLVGTVLLERHTGKLHLVTMKTDTDGEFHYFSDGVKGMRHRECIEKVLPYSKGKRASAYRVINPADRFIAPLLALTEKWG
jgi:hypothetical protein